MNIETLKPFVALLTFFLGLFSTPFVEYLKNRSIRKNNIKNLRTELADEVEHLEKRIQKMASSLEVLTALKNKETHKAGPLTYVPRKTSVLFVDSVLGAHYSYIEKKKRSSLKSIQVLIDAIQKCCKELAEIEMAQENIERIIKLKKSFIYSACCLRYNMQYVICSTGKSDTEQSDDEVIINQQLRELKLSLTFKDLLTKKTLKIT